MIVWLRHRRMSGSTRAIGGTRDPVAGVIPWHTVAR